MIGIITALHCEAAPLINHFGLLKDTSTKGQPVFHGDDCILVESGPGRVRSAHAVGMLVNQIRIPSLSLINFGTCGAIPEMPLGSIHRINRIIDASSRKRFYPDILFHHPFEEGAIQTFDSPVRDIQSMDTTCSLADMESAGFFEAASICVSPDRISVLKIVSDHIGAGAFPNSRQIQALIESRAEDISSFVLSQNRPQESQDSALGQEGELILSKVSSALQLTLSQRKILLREAKSYVLRSGGALSHLLVFSLQRSASKQESRRRFSEIIAVLRQDI